jgi:predicted CXXCH cytochrome family protein
MGQSAAYFSQASPLEKFDTSAHPTFTSGLFELRAEKTSDGVRHCARPAGETPAPVAELVLPAEITIGSGTRGRSYLAVQGGAVWQTPVSWFGPEKRWDLSPGFRLGTTARRAIAPQCLFCHVDRVEPIPGAENRYREPLFAHQAAIGCERCHGPGELHVAARSGGAEPAGTDTSIVNPQRLTPALQSAICEQCHLQGQERVERRGRDVYEFRPGLPFEQFVSVYVRHPEIAEHNKSVGQFEQMEKSRCFAGSGGRLVCTSCHDPHLAPTAEAKDQHYRKRCLSCHESKGCSLPQPERQAKGDSCVACHMPRTGSANIPHTSITDHHVPRKPSTPPTPRGLSFGTSPLLRFREGPLSPPTEEHERDLGIALARFGTLALPPGITNGDVRWMAAERLRSSLNRWPGDAEAWIALATAREGKAAAADKFQAASTAAALAPGSEAALILLVDAARGVGKYDVGVDAAGKLIRMNPTSTDALIGRAFVYLTAGDWAKAEADCREALRINPIHPEAHLYLAVCLYHKGDLMASQREAETAARLESSPAEREYLRGWYQRAVGDSK